MKKKVLAAALCVGLLSTSCLGPNRTFNRLHDWNMDVTDNRWANEAVHLGLWIVPVYSLALLADIVIFNSIEWWGGESPVEE